MVQTPPISGTAWLLAVAVVAVVALMQPPAAAAQEDEQTNRIRVEYFDPKNPAYNPVRDLLKDRRTLEKVQEIFSPLRLPVELTLRAGDCEGVANAWYDHGAISICYEYVDEILQGLPKETATEGLTREDAAIGQLFFLFAHEMGHASFEVFKAPILGDEENAADHFAGYIMLQFGRDQARGLITGAAYTYNKYVQNPQVTAPLVAFSDIHAAPAQRFYNLVCLAYGADAELFADVVDKGYLPKSRAKNCKREYEHVAMAFRDLIVPHLDEQLAKQVLDKTWLPDVKAHPRGK
jgi:hypothetical protein